MTQAQAHTKATAKAKARARSPAARDAIGLLTDDHVNVRKMFKEFQKLKQAEGSDAAKAALVKKICRELTVHATVEEEIFYPAMRAAIDDDDLMDEALVEHSGAKQLIAELEGMAPSDALYDAKVAVLGENIDHHVGEERDEMFPKARKARLDLAGLGASIAARKKALQRN